MKTIPLLIALVLTGPAMGQLGDDVEPLKVFPTEGHAAAYVESTEPGKWVVLGEGFMPVPFKTVDGAKGIIFEAKGGTYGVLFFPPGDSQPKVARVVLGDVKPLPDDPDKPPPDKPEKVTAVTYVFEKDNTALPAPVLAALNKLNRQGIKANIFERDTTDGTGDVPEQHKAALAAANEAGLPCLVVEAGDTVVQVVDSPTTEEEVLGVVK